MTTVEAKRTTPHLRISICSVVIESLFGFGALYPIVVLCFLLVLLILIVYVLADYV